MILDFHSMTSDELRAEIARGNFPPIAGADGEGEAPPEAAPAAAEAPETPSMGEIMEKAATPPAEEAPEQPEAPEAPETPEEAPESATEALDPEQYNLALEFALDPQHEQYETAVEILKDHAPEAVLRAYGLTDDAPEMPDFEGDDPYPFLSEDEVTGIPEIDAARNEIREFRHQREEEQTQAQTEAELQAEEAARENFATDYRELAGEDAPFEIAEMDPIQKSISVALLGADGIEGIEDPKEFVREALAARDKVIEHKAVVDYIEGKREFKLPPVTERNGSSTAPPLTTAAEGKEALRNVVRRHSGNGQGVSG